MQRREELDYEVDGVVFKVNDLALWDVLGVAGREPRYAVALKKKPGICHAPVPPVASL